MQVSLPISTVEAAERLDRNYRWLYRFLERCPDLPREYVADMRVWSEPSLEILKQRIQAEEETKARESSLGRFVGYIQKAYTASIMDGTTDVELTRPEMIALLGVTENMFHWFCGSRCKEQFGAPLPIAGVRRVEGTIRPVHLFTLRGLHEWAEAVQGRGDKKPEDLLSGRVSLKTINAEHKLARASYRSRLEARIKELEQQLGIHDPQSVSEVQK